MLYIASDHGGFKMKEQLVKYLTKEFAVPTKALATVGRVEDLGPFKLNPKDDYPEFAEKVARAVTGYGLGVKVSKPTTRNLQLVNSQTEVGILICRSGQGMCMAANKFPGVRAALAWNVKTAKASRQDDLANILCLPADYVSLLEAKKIVTAWLDTPWGKDKRFARRAAEVDSLA
jgi:ribose 5-phosphate isomerase B